MYSVLQYLPYGDICAIFGNDRAGHNKNGKHCTLLVNMEGHQGIGSRETRDTTKYNHDER